MSSTWHRSAAALVTGWLLASPPTASAIDFFDGRIQIHGYGEMQLRTIADNYATDRAYFSQWANILNIETELDLLPDGIGPITSVTGYVRLEARYDCIWTKVCGLAPSYDYFGDRATRQIEENTNGTTSGYSGVVQVSQPQRIHSQSGQLLPFYSIPPLRDLAKLGGTNIQATFAPLGDDALFAIRKIDGSLGSAIFPMGPWRPHTTIVPNASLASVHNPTVPNLPLRPVVPDRPSTYGGAHGLYIPSTALRERMSRYDDFDQNFSQNELAWNYGAGQDEHELKEAYLDVEMFDGRLFLRLGKQNIVWGKTELFRATDQFNPQDFALSSLPSLEESRLALWAARAIYSFYDVGPLEDVRLEVAANLDDFEPADFGKCGEPYAVWLVCGKSFGLLAHGVLGDGLAGEQRPSNPWDHTNALEIGGRVEFRWDRFSFALTDFWGYSDFPVARNFNQYYRGVDPNTGQPVDVNGNVLNPNDPNVQAKALTSSPQNRQFFDVFCSATVGLATAVFPALDKACLLDLVNDPTPILLGIGPAPALAAILTGTNSGGVNAQFLLNTIAGTTGVTYPLTRLNVDPNDGPPSPPFLTSSLSRFLTNEQEALLGCGPFYGTNCDRDGADLYNAEASVMLQAFPSFEPGGPVATRYVNGKTVILPGARGPGDAGYSVLVDGTPPPGFHSEMQALSKNFLTLLAYLDASGGKDPACQPTDPITCLFVQAIFAATGTRRPELTAGGNGRFGRRDFLWHGGSELELFYPKRNVLGFAMDFAEDYTKTNWNMEASWSSGEGYTNTRNAQGYSIRDTFGLTVSVDRPTFVNFLNQNRTFFMNAQLFTRYISNYQRRYTFRENGPFNFLGTFTITTGYFQDRLLPAITFVHDLYSGSGAILPQITYRFSERFSATFGLASFYGDPDFTRVAASQPVLANNGGNFMVRDNYQILSALAQRDEVYMTVRYTF